MQREVLYVHFYNLILEISPWVMDVKAILMLKARKSKGAIGIIIIIRNILFKKLFLQINNSRK